ncbi:MAG: type II toxin-antitoxin system RelE/ParE family toxin [Clostridiales bacterium]|nr:type II toxin-antitoxin system RelE/ParE family toxin [Clostridiales bacterium]
MKYNVLITGQAERDLNNAAAYIRSTLLNPAAAHTLLAQTRKEIASLAAFPLRYGLVDDPVLASWGVRFLTVNNYLAFYTVSTEAQTVYILRFLHSRRDWAALLNQNDFP